MFQLSSTFGRFGFGSRGWLGLHGLARRKRGLLRTRPGLGSSRPGLSAATFFTPFWMFLNRQKWKICSRKDGRQGRREKKRIKESEIIILKVKILNKRQHSWLEAWSFFTGNKINFRRKKDVVLLFTSCIRSWFSSKKPKLSCNNF